MSRPKPTVLLEKINRTTYNRTQVLEATSLYAVYYNNLPINIKSENILVASSGAKYKKSSFANKGNAISLAKKLNKEFNTVQFTVVDVITSCIVFSE
jgi:hypothetical protein